MEEENSLLKEKVSQLIADNLELSSKLEYDYSHNQKSSRKLTLQEKLEINMGNLIQKYRIPSKIIKNIYFTILTSEPSKEPEYIDLSFDNDRMYTAFYFVDLDKEAKEIEKGESVDLDVEKIPDSMPNIQYQADIKNVINNIMEIKTNNESD